MNTKQNAALYKVAFVVVVAFALGLSFVAYLGELKILGARRGLDKIVHFLLAGALAFTLDGALDRRNLHAWGVRLPLAPLLVLVPCAIDEWLQRYSAMRTSSLWDFVADFAGVTCAVGLGRFIARRAA